MPTIPEGAKVPGDHKTKVAPVVDDDELLADLPELVPPTKLRPRQRNVIMKLALGMRELVKRVKGITSDDLDDAEDVSIDMESLGDEDLGAVLDVFADIDEFAESIATDPKKYIEWSQKSSYDQLSALLSRYSSAVGESTGSSS